jgi:hypothetical protein
MESNRMKAARRRLRLPAESRTDQACDLHHQGEPDVRSDLRRPEEDGKPVGNGDPSLTMYGESITPNLHKLALQFGVLDNFYDSGEVSGDGHVWSNAAIGTDYLEKTWQQNVSRRQRTYDYEGVVAKGYPLLQKIPDVNEPASGYLWGNLAAHGKTLLPLRRVHCDDLLQCEEERESAAGADAGRAKCAQAGSIAGRGAAGGVGRRSEQVAVGDSAAGDKRPTKPELVGHFAPEAPDFNLRFPTRFGWNFLRHLKGWVADRRQGKDTMPNFVMLRLGNDHTAGTRPGGPTPKSSVADNDLAVGRRWSDLALAVLGRYGVLHPGRRCAEWRRPCGRASQPGAGGEQVRAARADGGPFVDSRFYSTVSVVRTMETLLGLPPMNNNDALLLADFDAVYRAGRSARVAADYANRDNGLIYTANPRRLLPARREHEDGLPPCRPRRCAEAECDFVEGRDGGCADTIA